MPPVPSGRDVEEKAMPPTFDHGAPSDDEQLLLELINRARANPQAEAMRYSIDLNEGITSSFIAPEPRPPVAFNKFLLKSTRQHSQWMVDVDKLDHFEK